MDAGGSQIGINDVILRAIGHVTDHTRSSALISLQSVGPVNAQPIPDPGVNSIEVSFYLLLDSRSRVGIRFFLVRFTHVTVSS